MVKEQVDRRFRLPLEDDIKQNKKENGIPLVVTYNLTFKNLSTIPQKNFDILYSDVEIRMVFAPSLFVAYRSARNLESFLATPNVYPLEGTVDSPKCGSKRCQVCLNFSEIYIFESFQTKRQYKINHHLNCYNKCLVYLLSSKIFELQYIDSTLLIEFH